MPISIGGEYHENEYDMAVASAKKTLSSVTLGGSAYDMDLAENISNSVPRRVEDSTSARTMPPQASTEATGALPGGAPILPTGSFSPASLGSVADDIMPLNAQYAMSNKPPIPQMEGITAEIDQQAAGISRGASVPGPGKGKPTIFHDEKVDQAAIKIGDQVLKGKTHFEIIQNNPKIDLEKAADGFVTSSGRFISREEAMQIHAGQ